MRGKVVFGVYSFLFDANFRQYKPKLLLLSRRSEVSHQRTQKTGIISPIFKFFRCFIWFLEAPFSSLEIDFFNHVSIFGSGFCFCFCFNRNSKFLNCFWAFFSTPGTFPFFEKSIKIDLESIVMKQNEKTLSILFPLKSMPLQSRWVNAKSDSIDLFSNDFLVTQLLMTPNYLIQSNFRYCCKL